MDPVHQSVTSMDFPSLSIHLLLVEASGVPRHLKCLPMEASLEIFLLICLKKWPLCPSKPRAPAQRRWSPAPLHLLLLHVFTNPASCAMTSPLAITMESAPVRAARVSSVAAYRKTWSTLVIVIRTAKSTR